MMTDARVRPRSRPRGSWLWSLLLAWALLLAWERPARAQDVPPCPLPTTYQVQPGDTLSLIAERFGTDVPTLVQLNDLPNPNHIWVGQVLRLPCTVRAHDQALYAALGGIALGQALPQGPASNGWARLWRAREQAQETLAAAPVPASVAWLPPTAYPGDTVVLRVRPRADVPITASVRIIETWFPLAVTDGGALVGFVPLHGLVEPGVLSITLRLEAATGLSTTVDLPVWVREKDFGIQHIYLPPDKGNLLDAERIREEAERLTEVWQASRGAPRWDTPFAWPVDIRQWPTTSPYGVRRSYNGGPVRSYHTGQDIAAPEGTPVYAPAPGVVVLAEPLFVRGNAVIIDHGAGVTSNYWHLSEMLVEPGQEVTPGEIIGRVGTTGLSTGAHLHWEMRVFGVPVDPIWWTRHAARWLPHPPSTVK